MKSTLLGCSPSRRRRAVPFAPIALALVLMSVVPRVAMAGRDYYDILGVPRDAEARTIKRAYRRMAKLYHPDRNNGDKMAEDKFTKISAAYEVLSDPRKKQIYDQFGEQGLEQNSGGGFGNFGGFRRGSSDFFHEGMFGSFGGGGRGFRVEFGDMGGAFSDFFTMGGGGRRAGAYATRGNAGGSQRSFRTTRTRGNSGRSRVCRQSRVCENGGCAMVEECSFE